MSGKITVKTNNRWREFVLGCELTPAERKEFDYVSELETHDFIRYKGLVYDPNEFLVLPGTLALHEEWADIVDNWDAYLPDSYFSGVLIRYRDDFEEYQIGTYM